MARRALWFAVVPKIVARDTVSLILKTKADGRCSGLCILDLGCILLSTNCFQVPDLVANCACLVLVLALVLRVPFLPAAFARFRGAAVLTRKGDVPLFVAFCAPLLLVWAPPRRVIGLGASVHGASGADGSAAFISPF